MIYFGGLTWCLLDLLASGIVGYNKKGLLGGWPMMHNDLDIVRIFITRVPLKTYERHATHAQEFANNCLSTKR